MARLHFALAATLAAAGQAMAQEWTVTILHPQGAEGSDVLALTGDRQGGWHFGPTGTFGGFWAGSAASWATLTDPQSSGVVVGMDRTRQVGGMGGYAAMWFGTAQSFVNLHPGGATGSGLAAVHGNEQAGNARYPFDTYRAAVWQGTAKSFVNLHPPTALGDSFALATDGARQGGWAMWPHGQWIVRRATIWHGSPESYVDLSPDGLTSRVEAMAPGIQVGWVQMPEGSRASVWHGTPESWTNMQEPGHTGSSRFYATTGRIHAGRRGQSGLARATINFGTPEEWLDLHQFLPAQYGSFSAANAVHQQGNTIYVGGYATNSTTHIDEAVLWIGPTPPRLCYANCDQSTNAPVLTVDDFTCFINEFAMAQSLPLAQQVTHYANCDGSTSAPILTVNDFTCFINAFAQGCP